jgi:hypothetical protein
LKKANERKVIVIITLVRSLHLDGWDKPDPEISKGNITGGTPVPRLNIRKHRERNTQAAKILKRKPEGYAGALEVMKHNPRGI